MPIDFACHCGMRSRAPDALAGNYAKCPGCGQTIVVPHPAAPLPSRPDPLMSLSQPGPPAADPLGNPLPSLSRPLASRQSSSQESVHPLVWIAMGVGTLAIAGAIVVATIVTLSSNGADRTVARTYIKLPEDVPTFEEPSIRVPIEIPVETAPPMEPTPEDEKEEEKEEKKEEEASEPEGSESKLEVDDTVVTNPLLGKLPPGIEAWRTKQQPLRGMQRFDDKMPVYGYSWMVELLPYLGHEDIYNSFDRTKTWADPANLQVTSKTIPEFLNPADSQTRFNGYPFHNMALTHYVGMAGIEDGRNVVAGELSRNDPRAGVFGYDEIARPDQIKDGTSQTIMIIGSGSLAAPWVQGGGATIRGARAPYFDEITGFGSKGLTSPGAQVLMADGSVRAIPANIDPAVFKAMCTIAGAETVDLTTVPSLPFGENTSEPEKQP